MIRRTGPPLLLKLFLRIILLVPPGLCAQDLEPRPDIILPAYNHQAIVVSHTGFTLSYNEEWEQPEWVAYELTREEVLGSVARSGSFRADPRIPSGSAAVAHYVGTGYDRGHLVPAADQRWSRAAMRDSFYMSNVSPQTPGFNRGIWSSLEAAVRGFALANGSVFVVTGPVLTHPPLEHIGPGRLPVPRLFYKVILDYTPPELKGIGFLLPHEASSDPLSAFAVTIDSVEELTGLDFYPGLPDHEESKLESQCEPLLWFGSF